MPVFEQRKPKKTTGLDKGEKLIRVSVDLTPAELELLDSLVAVTGLSTRTRCIRWLMRVWQTCSIEALPPDSQAAGQPASSECRAARQQRVPGSGNGWQQQQQGSSSSSSNSNG